MAAVAMGLDDQVVLGLHILQALTFDQHQREKRSRSGYLLVLYELSCLDPINLVILVISGLRCAVLVGCCVNEQGGVSQIL